MRLSIKTKLAGVVLVVVGMLAVIAGISYRGLDAMMAATDALKEHAEHTSNLKETKSLVASEWQFYTDYSLTLDKDVLKDARLRGQQALSWGGTRRDIRWAYKAMTCGGPWWRSMR